MATHGNISEFNAEAEDWKSYTERLQQYFTANDVDSAEKQRAILRWCTDVPTDRESIGTGETDREVLHGNCCLSDRALSSETVDYGA